MKVIVKDNKYVIQASNGMFFKRDMLNGEWVGDIRRASKFGRMEKATMYQSELVNQYKVDCNVVKLGRLENEFY